ncbi:hypothetical protein [Candidatus Cyanaurora vandensis]|uniref:hypothetical protein n=1 Tax=Candidatus Cyanaurora vandensis TaxID=2714958 RepID=UPI0037C19FCB
MPSLEALFCPGDDFCPTFTPSRQPEAPQSRALGLSEMMTIVIAFHQSAYRHFKAFYTQPVCQSWRTAFPGLVSYSRFIEWLSASLQLLSAELPLPKNSYKH